MSDKLKIIVTDSGLGGLIVYFHLSKLFKSFPIAKEIDLIFFNALYEKDYGYNDMETEEEKISMLDWVLKSMEVNYQPDHIVIACNTLSVLVDKTKSYKKYHNKIFGIVDPALDLLTNIVTQKKDFNFIIMGTPTTINSGIYQQKLKEFGLDEKRIISQPCPKLETAIQDDPQGDETLSMLEDFLFEAADKIIYKNDDTAIFLACTHYSILEYEIMNTAEFAGIENVEIFDPSYIQAITFASGFDLVPGGKVNHSVVSRVPLFENEKMGMLNELSDFSEEALSAVFNYRLDPNLF